MKGLLQNGYFRPPDSFSEQICHICDLIRNLHALPDLKTKDQMTELWSNKGCYNLAYVTTSHH